MNSNAGDINLSPCDVSTSRNRMAKRNARLASALDPVAETTADRNSYGFRQQRSCADAIQQCFNALTNANTQWILEGDIRSCFDKISHDWLMAHVPSNAHLTVHYIVSATRSGMA